MIKRTNKGGSNKLRTKEAITDESGGGRSKTKVLDPECHVIANIANPLEKSPARKVTLTTNTFRFKTRNLYA